MRSNVGGSASRSEHAAIGSMTLSRTTPQGAPKPEFRHPIDYIFTSKGLAARGVLDVTVGDAPADAVAAREEPWPSDHLALLVEVELP